MIVWGIALIQTILFIIIAPLLTGVVKWFKCQLQNRSGPSILQPYRNLIKLFRKDVVIANTASSLFLITPYIVFSIMILIASTIPFLIVIPSMSAIADVIVLVGLLALARFFLSLAGMDVGTAFGGMGSSREMLIAAIAEPALLMTFFTVAMFASSTNLSIIVAYFAHNQLLSSSSIIFAAVGFALVAVAETGRIPIDNPATHLELTMIHEAMILEYSGHHLALIEWASQIKFAIYCTLLINLFLPWGIADIQSIAALLLSSIAFAFKVIILCLTLAITEINLAKLRLFRAPFLLNLAFLLCLLGLLNHIILEAG
jgi:formate hydrogenlyase subunit 4